MKKTKFKHSAINIYNAQHPIKITKHAKKLKNETYNQEENQSAEKGPKITDLMELADKTSSQILQKLNIHLKENLNIMRSGRYEKENKWNFWSLKIPYVK